MKQLTIITIFLFYAFNYAFGCCAGPTQTFSEMLLHNSELSLLLVQVDSTWEEADEYGFGSEFVSKAFVLETYGKPAKDNTIYLYTGSHNSSAGSKLLIKGNKYFIVNISNDGKKYYAFVCDNFSQDIKKYSESLRGTELPNKPDYYQITKNYYEKINSKYTGQVEIGDSKHLFAKGMMKNGLIDGKWTHYIYNNEEEKKFIRSTESYKNGKLDGELFIMRDTYGRLYHLKKWYRNNKIIETQYYNRKDFFISLEIETLYKPNFVQKTSWYYDSKKNNIGIKTTLHFPNLNESYRLRNINPLHGYYEGYFNTGILKEKGNYFWGAKVGSWIYYDEKGNQVKTEFFEKISDIENNDFIIYYPNRTIHVKGEIINGKPEGIWQIQYESSEILDEIVFENGKIKSK